MLIVAPMPKPRSLVGAVLTLLPLLFVASCDGSKEDDVVGATCSRQSDCRFQCELPSPDFPGGYCTVACQNDTGCPRGDTLCMDVAGGICLFVCTGNADCQFLGPGWICGDRDRKGQGGKANVCIGD